MLMFSHIHQALPSYKETSTMLVFCHIHQALPGYMETPTVGIIILIYLGGSCPTAMDTDSAHVPYRHAQHLV